MSVLVWIELSKSGPVANSWEVLGQGKLLADALGVKLVAAVIGSDTAKTAVEAQKFGPDTVLTLTDPRAGQLSSERLRSRAEKSGCRSGRHRRARCCDDVWPRSHGDRRL